MDAALYLNLREEMQQDAARVERQLEQLRRAESFLLRRIKTARHLSSYQVVLNDVASDIARAEEAHAELLHLSRFVTRALITAYAAEPVPKVVPEPAPQNPANIPTVMDVFDTITERPRHLPPDDDEPNNHKPPAPVVSSHHDEEDLIEFDVDGFLISGPSSQGKSEEENGEPPTVVFDVHGFPLNLPADDSMNTLIEPRKPKSPQCPLPTKQS
jgi:hypothetical protein